VVRNTAYSWSRYWACDWFLGRSATNSVEIQDFNQSLEGQTLAEWKNAYLPEKGKANAFARSVEKRYSLFDEELPLIPNTKLPETNIMVIVERPEVDYADYLEYFALTPAGDKESLGQAYPQEDTDGYTRYQISNNNNVYLTDKDRVVILHIRSIWDETAYYEEHKDIEPKPTTVFLEYCIVE
jgi:hypothetical protein